MVFHTVAILGVIFLLSFLSESLVEYLIGTPLDKLGASKFKWLLMYVSMGVGISMAIWYKLDIVNLLAGVLEENIEPSIVGFILTGLGIGRGANWMHQLVTTYFPGKA